MAYLATHRRRGQRDSAGDVRRRAGRMGCIAGRWRWQQALAHPERRQSVEPGMTRVVTALAVSADGFIAGPNDGPGNPLGDGGGRLFEWYTDGDTQSRFFPNFKLSPESAKVFDDGAANVGAIISGRRTYEISNAWGGRGPLPGVPLFVLTHNPPSNAPDSDPPYTFVTGGIADAISMAKQAAGDDKVVALMGS